MAKEQILPHVRTMENEKKINDSVLKALFDNGVRVYNMIIKCRIGGNVQKGLFIIGIT